MAWASDLFFFAMMRWIVDGIQPAAARTDNSLLEELACGSMLHVFLLCSFLSNVKCDALFLQVLSARGPPPTMYCIVQLAVPLSGIDQMLAPIKYKGQARKEQIYCYSVRISCVSVCVFKS